MCSKFQKLIKKSLLIEGKVPSELPPETAFSWFLTKVLYEIVSTIVKYRFSVYIKIIENI